MLLANIFQSSCKENIVLPNLVLMTNVLSPFNFLLQILSRWEKYLSKVRTKKVENANIAKIKELFPFHKFFENAPQPLFKGRTYAEDLDIAEGCFRHIEKIFQQLEV